MPHPSKSNKHTDHGGKGSDVAEAPSNNLWIGNLSSEVTDSDLMNLFGKHGAVDSITSYASRSYAFIYFKRMEDAEAAKDALQGTVVRGNQIKIQFARPAKPCKSLWVSGISPSVSKEKLEVEFLRFGKIEEFKFLRDRNTAFVDYGKLEDAFQALKSMNGKQIGGEQIRVDFLRSQPSRREQWPDFRNAREGQFPIRSMGPPDSPWIPQDFIRNYSDPTHFGPKREQHSQSSGVRKGDGQPSNVLWIRYPPSVHIDEQMLYNALILFGEIERIRNYPLRQYAFVEFRSVDEARCAKEGLQGRLFNDPRILIMFSSSELAPSKDYSGFYRGVKGPRPDMFLNELPFRPSQLEILDHSYPMVPNNFPGPLPPSDILGPNLPITPFGPQGSFEPLLSGAEFNDLAVLHKLPDINPNIPMGGPNWRRSSPGPGMLPSPSPGMNPPIRPVPGVWDVFDANEIQRESKRSRINGPLHLYDSSYPPKEMDDQGLGLDPLYGLGPQVDGNASGPVAIVQRKNHLSPEDTRFTTGGTIQGHPDHDYIWRGIIAKGGTPVCHARCVPIRKGIEFDIPEVINCSARTGLDMLTEHYAKATGFNIVFFLPDSEDDFDSYTEFLSYLSSKNRAGVAKFDDGTTLFLAPPSDFLTKVLNVTGPERLYGVVLKFPQHSPSSTSMQSQSQSQSLLIQSQYIDRQKIAPPRTEYSVMPQEEKVLQRDYSRVLHERTMTPPKQLVLPSSDSLPVQPITSINTGALSQAGVTLTPELIATLVSLLPAKEKPSGLESAPSHLGSSSSRPLLPSNAALDNVILPQGYDRQAPEQTGQSLQQLGNQFNPQGQLLPQLQAYPTVSNAPSHSAQGVTGSSQIQDPASNLPQQVEASSRPLNNFAISSQSGQFAVSPQVNQQYQYEVTQNTRKSYGMAHGRDAFRSHGSSVPQQPINSITLSNQVHSANVSQPDIAMPVATEKVISELPEQGQQLQSALYGAGQGTSEVEVDKNQRYQSTLQFAANLLLQIQQQQQQQQQTSTRSGQRLGNH